MRAKRLDPRSRVSLITCGGSCEGLGRKGGVGKVKVERGRGRGVGVVGGWGGVEERAELTSWNHPVGSTP